MRNAELKWEVDRGATPTLTFRIPHFPFRIHALTRAMSRPTVLSDMRITSPPTAPAVGNSSIAGRRPKRSDRYPMSGGAIASPARWENSTYAPSTDARTAAGTTSRITADSGPLYHE